ncbi:MAG: SDR family NAD(P)-dependent oxidoreductase [Candidatus Kryptoniota bacterium]
MEKSLQGKVALVTGRSVGKELAEIFLNNECNVGFVYRSRDREGELMERFASYGQRFLLIHADLSNENSAEASVKRILDSFGRIDFLLNALGGWLGGKKLHEHSLLELEKMLSMDLIPTFNIMKAVLPVMVKQKFGKIVNFVSMQIYEGGAKNSVYTASKSAVDALSRAATREYLDDGISVFTIAPSIIDTEANRAFSGSTGRSHRVTPKEIGEAVLFLCREMESASGTTLRFPGKLT